MRSLKMLILGMAVLCAGATASAADAPVAPVAAPEVLEEPAAPAPVSIADLFTGSQELKIAIPCPPEPITSCHSCFSFGQWLSYTCTTFCQNGMPRRTCGSCGQGCPL